MSFLLTQLITANTAAARTRRRAKRKAAGLQLFARTTSIRTFAITTNRFPCSTLLDLESEASALETIDARHFLGTPPLTWIHDAEITAGFPVKPNPAC